MADPCIITQMRYTDFMKLEFVDVELGPGVNTIEGQNRQGKTAFMLGIEWCLGGDLNGHCPEEPIRHGAPAAEVVTHFGRYKVTRRREAGKKSTVKFRDTVANKDLDRPAERLRALIGELTFDPLAFRDKKEKEQIEILRKVYGLEFADLDAERAKVYAERTKVNHAKDQQEGQLLGTSFYPDAPLEELDFGDLTAELTLRHEQKAANDKVRRDAAEADATLSASGHNVSLAAKEIGRLQKLLIEAEKAYEAAKQSHDTALDNAMALSDAAEGLVDPDIDEIQLQIKTASATNRQVRENAEYQSLSSNVDALRAESDGLTARLAKIDEEKLLRLKAAESRCPIPGIGLDGDQVRLSGVPLSQASEEEQLSFCLEISAALNPTLQTILIDRGEALDPQSRLRIAQWANARGLQVIMGVVTDGSPSEGIVISNGRVLNQEK